MSGWKPIETAPRDGSRVLLGADSTIAIGRWRHDWPKRDQQWMGDSDAGWIEPDWPTHWMPLPEPPQ